MNTLTFAFLLFLYTFVVYGGGGSDEQSKRGFAGGVCFFFLCPAFVALYHWS